MLINSILTILSLVLLIVAASWVVDNAIIIARKAKLSPLVIGTTIVGFGTVLPTIAVNLAILFSKEPNFDIAIGNMIGTNYVNLGLALGIPAFMTTIITKYGVFEKEIPLYLGIVALLTSFAADGRLSQVEGALMFISYLIIGLIIYQYAKRETHRKETHKELMVDKHHAKPEQKSAMLGNFAVIFAGLAVLIFAAFVLTYSAPVVAESLGISQYVTGLTIVGVGTSLPTVVASIKAAKKGYLDIVLGNVFGGNIVNIGIGIGLPAILREFPIGKEGLQDIYFTNFYNVIILFAILIEMKLLGGNKVLSRVSGALIVCTYLFYISSKIFSFSTSV